MNGISFKNINLFKTPQRSANSKPPQNHKENGKSFWKKIIESQFLYMFLFVASIAWLTTYIPSKELPLPEIGSIATEDIVTPFDLTIADQETTTKRQEEATSNVLPVYRFDRNVFLITEEKIRELFSTGRETFEESVSAQETADFQILIAETYDFNISTEDLRYLIRIKFAPATEENLINLLGKISSQGILASKNLLIHQEEEKGLTLITGENLEGTIRIQDILDLKESRQALLNEINSLDLPSGDSRLLANLTQDLIQQNVTYDPLETRARQDQARASVETVFYTLKQGKVIVRKGDEVTEENLKEIKIINENISGKPSWLTNFGGTFLLFALLFFTLWFYLTSLLHMPKALRTYIMMGVLLIISILIYKASIFLAGTFSQSTGFALLQASKTYYYAFPFQFGTLVFAFLTSIPVALVFTIINSLAAGYLLNDFNFMIYALIGGFAAIYGIKYYGKQKRTTTFQSGLVLIAPVSLTLIITFHLITERLGPWENFAGELLMGVIGGVLSASLAFLFLPVFENLFGFITQTKLLELTNSDLPIFKRMAIEAPGTYHHSLIVSSLASEAAKEIDVDPMVVKAGSMYHDVGKIKRPEYFIENRTRYDMHKALKPSMSKLVIINHVKEGMEIAKKLKLPRKIRDSIEQHHGTSLVKYFFEKAKEEYDPEMQTVGEESYRYPGPVPKSREAALVMLADSIEAATRSLNKPTEQNIRRLITEIFNRKIDDGQLDDCDFSLRELRLVAGSFASTLYSIYHPRIEYPGFDFESKGKKANNGKTKAKTHHDRNHKPAEQVLDKKNDIPAPSEPPDQTL
jgi:putative nucleotidyltransferase with HDIG domain